MDNLKTEHPSDVKNKDKFYNIYKKAVDKLNALISAVDTLTNTVEDLDIPSIIGLEEASNKVASISSTSTDVQYPSAKALYAIRNLLNLDIDSLRDVAGITSTLRWIGTLNQTGTDAPVATGITSTLGTIVWTYSDVGIYIGTLTGAFPARFTSFYQSSYTVTGGTVTITRIDNDTIRITALDGSSTPVDGIVDDLLLEITTTTTSVLAQPKEFQGYTSQVNLTATSGTLEVGKDYIIDTLESGDDFANVGYVTPGVAFTATGDTPTTWTNGTSVLCNTDSVPSFDVMKNTIGTITWQRISAGLFHGTLANAFPTDKTFIVTKTIIPVYNSAGRMEVSVLSSSTIVIETFSDAAGTHADDIISTAPFYIIVNP